MRHALTLALPKTSPTSLRISAATQWIRHQAPSPSRTLPSKSLLSMTLPSRKLLSRTLFLSRRALLLPSQGMFRVPLLDGYQIGYSDFSSISIRRRGFFHFILEKSARAINAVMTAIRHRGDKAYEDWPISESDGTTKSSVQPRKASDATASSEETKCSAATVHHWSSKHVIHPIQTTSSSDSLSDPRTSHSTTFVYRPSDYDPPAVSCLPGYGLPHRLFSGLGLHGRQMTAFISYNDLARKFGFYTLCPPEYDPISKSFCFGYA